MRRCRSFSSCDSRCCCAESLMALRASAQSVPQKLKAASSAGARRRLPVLRSISMAYVLAVHSSYHAAQPLAMPWFIMRRPTCRLSSSMRSSLALSSRSAVNSSAEPVSNARGVQRVVRGSSKLYQRVTRASSEGHSMVTSGSTSVVVTCRARELCAQPLKSSLLGSHRRGQLPIVPVVYGGQRKWWKVWRKWPSIVIDRQSDAYSTRRLCSSIRSEVRSFSSASPRCIWISRSFAAAARARRSQRAVQDVHARLTPRLSIRRPIWRRSSSTRASLCRSSSKAACAKEGGRRATEVGFESCFE